MWQSDNASLTVVLSRDNCAFNKRFSVAVRCTSVVVSLKTHVNKKRTERCVSVTLRNKKLLLQGRSITERHRARFSNATLHSL